MGFIAQLWQARVGTGLNKFKNEIDGKTLVLVNTPDSITTPGTPFAADKMNRIETGIQESYPLWQAEVTYAINEIKSYNGKWYVSLQNNNKNYVPDVNSAWWKLASADSDVYVTGGSANAYTVTIPGISSYANMLNKVYNIQFHVASTSATVNINVNGLGNRRIYLYGTTTLPTSTYIAAGQVKSIAANATAFTFVDSCIPAQIGNPAVSGYKTTYSDYNAIGTTALARFTIPFGKTFSKIPRKVILLSDFARSYRLGQPTGGNLTRSMFLELNKNYTDDAQTTLDVNASYADITGYGKRDGSPSYAFSHSIFQTYTAGAISNVNTGFNLSFDLYFDAAKAIQSDTGGSSFIYDSTSIASLAATVSKFDYDQSALYFSIICSNATQQKYFDFTIHVFE